MKIWVSLAGPTVSLVVNMVRDELKWELKNDHEDPEDMVSPR